MSSRTMVQILLFLIQLFVYLSPTNANVACLNCPDVASPSDCRQSITCGQGEICFARELKETTGLRHYRLGCEDASICKLRQHVNPIVGKRDVQNTTDAPPTHCYDCCSVDKCNGNLCKGTGSACPDGSVQYKDRCYHFGMYETTFNAAYDDCSRHGRNLVSINSEEEQSFLLKTLRESPYASHIKSAVWTGGVYHNRWVWLDQSSWNYTNWMPGQPGYLSRLHFNQVIMYVPEGLHGEWASVQTGQYPFICESATI